MVKIKILSLFGLFLMFFHGSHAIELPAKITDHNFAANIRSAMIYRVGWPMSNPVIELNSDEVLELTFDDLSNTNKNYYYTIYHCNRMWELSQIQQQEYLPAFTEYPLNDKAYSINTKIGYVNYLLRLPNEDVTFKYSGNYVLVIYDSDDPSVPVLTRRFYVVENKVSIDARIRRASFEDGNGKNQEVDVKVNYQGVPVRDPYNDFHLVITQNNRSDNAITNLKPMFAQNDILDYDYNMENVFVGGNEFRYFGIRTIKFPGEGILEIGYEQPCYYALLEPAHIRVQDRYTFYREMNGKYVVETYEKDAPEVKADYILVHFTLPMENVLMGGGIFVYGAFNNWECNSVNEMHWNPNLNRYELSVLLKQGYYNYTYAWMDKKSNIIKCEALEGSHYETENDYFVYLYQSRITDRYDRLIGYKIFNSLSNRAYSF